MIHDCPVLFFRMTHLCLFLLFFVESNFTQIVELLHVPLQNLYKYQVKKSNKSIENGQIYQHHGDGGGGGGGEMQ